MERKRTRPDTAQRFIALWKGISEGRFAPVYVLYGPQDDRDLAQVQFLFDRTVHVVKERFLSDPGARFNLDAFPGGADFESALNAARTVPMFGERRLALLLDRQEPDERETGLLVRYLSDPVPHTILVVVFMSGRISRRIHAACKPLECLHRAERLRESELAGWIEARLRGRGLKAAPGVARAVAEHTGANLQAVEDAAEKLAIYTADKDRIDVGDVEECVLTVRQSEIFDLLDAIGERDAGKALAILDRLAGQRTDTLLINAMLSGQIRNLIKLHRYGGRPPGADAVAGELGIHPYAASKLLRQHGRFSITDLERALGASAEFNVQAKRSRVPAERLMEAMVLGIIRGQDA